MLNNLIIQCSENIQFSFKTQIYNMSETVDTIQQENLIDFDITEKQKFVKNIEKNHDNPNAITNIINYTINTYENNDNVLDYISGYIWKLDDGESNYNLAMILGMNNIPNINQFKTILKYTDISYLSKYDGDNDDSCLFDILLSVPDITNNLLLLVIQNTPINIISDYNIALYIMKQIELGNSNKAILTLNNILRHNPEKTIYDFRKVFNEDINWSDDNIEINGENDLFNTLCNFSFIRNNTINDKYATEIYKIFKFLFENVNDINVYGNILIIILLNNMNYIKRKLKEVEKYHLLRLLRLLDDYNYDFEKFEVYKKIKRKLISNFSYAILDFLKEKCNKKHKFNTIYLTNDCSICLNNYQDKEVKLNRVVFNPCGHSICSNCNNHINNTCPICRENIENIININY